MGEPWPVPAALGGERLDRALSLITGLSRSEAGALIDARRVRLGQRVATTRSRRVRAGETVEVEGSIQRGAAALEADAAVEVPVVWCDQAVVVVDKPAGLVVHPGAGNRSGTLVQGLLARFPDLASLGDERRGPSGSESPASQSDVRRPGIVHRLDKGTSGLLVVARTADARESLVRQLAARTVGREYLALVRGAIESDAGVVDAPLGRSSTDPTRIRVQAGGRQARTRYEVIGRWETPLPSTLVRCRLETGRTHQIRVHLATIGHPVVGDDRYGVRGAGGWRPLLPGRHFLHAAMLSFDHPSTLERLRFDSALPSDLQAVLAGLGPAR
jgi:23S rRNA pseudouridine1911/1915/1917 synthase